MFREVPPVFIVEQANHAPGDHAIIFAYLTFSEKKVSFGQIETYENVGQFFVSFRAEWSGLTKNLEDYLSCEKNLCCGGSWMVKGDLVKAGEFDKIRELTAEAKKLADSIRK